MPSKKSAIAIASKGQTTAVVELGANPRTAGIWEITASDRASATQLGIALDGDLEACMARAAGAANQAALRAVEAGYLLMSAKSQAEHGDFEAQLEAIGMSSQRASEFMRMARFTSMLPDDRRIALIAAGKSKVLALASADPEVVQAMLEDGDVDLNLINVKDLRNKIRELEANSADLAVQRDTAQAELEGARKRLAKPQGEREDKVPVVVADLRAEIVALAKKAELVIGSFQGVGSDLGLLVGTDQVHGWVDPTVRLAVSALSATRLQLDGVLKYFLTALDGQDPTPTERSYLSRPEVLDAAKVFPQLVSMHTWEKDLREWEAEQARPREKGRPRAKPEAPTK